MLTALEDESSDASLRVRFAKVRTTVDVERTDELFSSWRTDEGAVVCGSGVIYSGLPAGL